MKIIESKQCEKQYSLNTLPTKYHPYYTYAKQVLNALKGKRIVSKLENKEGVFCLRANESLEASFSSGYVVSYKKPEKHIRVRFPGNEQKLLEI